MTDRRNFLKNAALISGGLLFSKSMSSLASVSTPAPIKEIGLQLYSIRDLLAKEVRTSIAKVSQIGYKHVETFYGYDPSAPKAQLWGLSPKELKSLLVDNSLKSYSGHYQLNDFLTKGNGNGDALKFQIDIAAELGQQCLIVPIPPFGLWDKLTESDFHYMADQLNKAGEICVKSGLQVGYHNHFWEFRTLPGGKKGYDILLSETNPKQVVFEMDVFWVEKSGVNPADYFKKYPGRFPMWHVKDMDKAKTAPITGGALDQKPSMEILTTIGYTEVGTGAIDYKKIFSHAGLAGLKRIFVEQDTITKDPFQSIEDSFKYVQANLIKS